MEKAKLSLSLQCPDHELAIGMLNADPKAKKIGYCYECIAENDGDATNLKTIPAYLKDNASFYEKCRQRAHDAGEPPAEYTEEFSNKGERLERFSKHIDEEKDKVKKNFEEIRKAVKEIIDDKEKECLELLDKEISGLPEVYMQFEKFLMMGWPKLSDLQHLYPETETLKHRISQIESMDQLQAFMSGIQEDVKIQDMYFKEDEEDGLARIKKKIDGLIRSLSIEESSLPKINMGVLTSENLMKDLMKEFRKEKVQVENSIISRMKASTYESGIMAEDQFETLQDWLPPGYNFDLKLLLRGSTDGMSPQTFHEKCDNKGATITLIKCRFKGVENSSIIGGFLDESWNSNNGFATSNKAFLFSLAEQNCNSIKCPIYEQQVERAFFGDSGCGPRFGGGHDLYVNNDFKDGGVSPCSYSNARALCNGNEYSFHVEDIEVYQVI